VTVEELEGRVAVVTGGASGIGRAMAQRFAAEGMQLVLADVEEPALAETVAALASDGARVIGVRCDVSVLADVEAVRDRALDEFGAVHVVCNNAGVGGGSVATTPIEQWNWVLGVNLHGVVHGCVTFLPLLLAQDEGHVVNTASMAGLGGNSALGVYCTTKFAVVGLSESLHYELVERGSNVGVSVLCPGFLATNIYTSERNMPEHVRAVAPEIAIDPSVMGFFTQVPVLAPEVAADAVLEAIRTRRFWLYTHPDEVRATSRTRLEWMLG
jgi:NAD(P)-dependent dehydrogenase (short-subunit alcohol dehydrogenase family)